MSTSAAAQFHSKTCTVRDAVEEKEKRSGQNTMATAATGAGGTGSSGPATGPVGGGAAVGRKKDGGPSSKFWESSETVSQLETVRLWIAKHYKKVRWSSIESEVGPRPRHNGALFSSTRLLSNTSQYRLFLITIGSLFYC